MFSKKEINPNIRKFNNSRKIYIPYYTMIIGLILVIMFLKYNQFKIDKFGLFISSLFVVLGIKLTEVHRLLNSYEITSDYMIHTYGLLSKRVKRIFIPTISDLVLRQTFWQRILNFGTVEVHRYSEGPAIYVYGINNPEKFMELLESKMLKKRGGGEKGGQPGQPPVLK